MRMEKNPKNESASERTAVRMLKFLLHRFLLRSPRPETSQMIPKKKKRKDVTIAFSSIVAIATSKARGANMISEIATNETLSGL